MRFFWVLPNATVLVFISESLLQSPGDLFAIFYYLSKCFLLSFWFLLPTGSILLFPLFNSLCCSSVCWDCLDCKSALCSICYPFSAQYRVLNSITQIINENTNWVEYGVDTHLPLQTFSQFNTQTLVNTFFVNCF